MADQNMVNQVIHLLEATLLPQSVKKAQDDLQQCSTIPGFASTLLQVMCNEHNSNHVRNAASVALKNFIRANWSGDGEAPLADDEREGLRSAILEAMFRVPQFLRPQMTEVVCQISKIDFPDRWPQLIQVLAQHLQTATDFEQLVVSLSTLEQMVNRYRHEMRSNRLWTEIILVVQNVAEPLTQLYSRMLQYLPDRSSTPLSYSDRAIWIQIVLELTSIYHSLISQDLSEYFEDNLTPWMDGFLHVLDLKLPELEQKALDTDPSVHDRLRAEICEIATLFSQRFEDCFMPYTERFIASVWNLLVQTDSRIRFDSLVNAALSFLAAICQRPHYIPYFRAEGVLKAICENVVVKNLMLRAEDLEIYELEPFDFLKRDLEGSDLETRRHGASEFVRALCKQFEAEVFGFLSSVIESFLTDYQLNPAENFVKKDLVYFLVSALASRGITARYGSTDTSKLIDVSQFYQKHVRADLLSGSPNELPILRIDALKYLILFRNQLSPAQIIECFRGENNQIETSIIRFSSSSHVLLHHYLAYAVERLLLLRSSDSPTALLTPENFPLGTLIDSLLECFKISQAYETHYIMKALMRLFSIINENMARTHSHIYVSHLSQMITEAIRVPKNPLLVHFIFESLCVLTRKAYSKIEGGMDKQIIPVIEQIMQNDVAEFTPYALQLIALLLDQSQLERQRGVQVSQDPYISFFPFLLRPDYWSRGANVPALMLVFESFIRCIPQLIFGPQYSEQLLAIFQRLIASKAYDQHGFRLANAFLVHLDNYEKMSSHVVLLTMLNRMHQNKTTKFSRLFTLFIFRFTAIKGGSALANTLEGIQSGLFSMILQKILLTEMHLMPQTTTYEEKRVVTIGASRLIAETISLLGQSYALLVEAVVNILEAFEHKAHHLSADQENGTQQDEQEMNELEYSDPYCKLAYAQHSEPFAPEVHNIKKHFAEIILVTVRGTNPESMECLNARVLSCLNAYQSNP